MSPRAGRAEQVQRALVVFLGGLQVPAIMKERADVAQHAALTLSVIARALELERLLIAALGLVQRAALMVKNAQVDQQLCMLQATLLCPLAGVLQVALGALVVAQQLERLSARSQKLGAKRGRCLLGF